MGRLKAHWQCKIFYEYFWPELVINIKHDWWPQTPFVGLVSLGGVQLHILQLLDTVLLHIACCGISHRSNLSDCKSITDVAVLVDWNDELPSGVVCSILRRQHLGSSAKWNLVVSQPEYQSMHIHNKQKSFCKLFSLIKKKKIKSPIQKYTSVCRRITAQESPRLFPCSLSCFGGCNDSDLQHPDVVWPCRHAATWLCSAAPAGDPSHSPTWNSVQIKESSVSDNHLSGMVLDLSISVYVYVDIYIVLMYSMKDLIQNAKIWGTVIQISLPLGLPYEFLIVLPFLCSFSAQSLSFVICLHFPPS